MRTLGFSLLLLVLAGCATLDGPPPLQASDIVALHESGVPKEVLDYLQRAQIDEIRWRDRYSQSYWYGPGYYRGGPWGC